MCLGSVVDEVAMVLRKRKRKEGESVVKQHKCHRDREEVHQQVRQVRRTVTLLNFPESRQRAPILQVTPRLLTSNIHLIEVTVVNSNG